MPRIMRTEEMGGVVNKDSGDSAHVHVGSGGVSLMIHIEETGNAMRIWLRANEALQLSTLLNNAISRFREMQEGS